MSRPDEPENPSQPATRARPWFWIVPALTFVVGTVLGAVVMAAGDGSDTGDRGAADARPTATVPTAAGRPSDRIITVPATCEQGLDRARAALDTVGDAVDALRDLDTARLQERLDQLQKARQEVDRLAELCRQQARERN